MKRLAPLVIASLCFAPLLSASSSAPDRQETIQRITQAVSKTDIFAFPSFLMKADVHIDNNGKPLDGNYEFLWNGPEQWRELVTFPGYNEVQVGGKGVVWFTRTTDFLPFGIHTLRAALGFGSGAAIDGFGDLASYVQMRVTAHDTIKKVRSRKMHGENLQCFDIATEDGGQREVCLNEASGTVARQEPYEDGNFQAVGGKSFPRFLSYKLNDKVVAKVNITELTTPAVFPPNSFALPSGASSQTGCMNPAPARIAKQIQPSYPEVARKTGVQGAVGIDVNIGTDGIPTVNKVVRSPDSSLEAASLTAVRNWRYEPALCDGKPVKVETVLTINYSLRY